ncbi:AAA family ATPase [Flavobacterium oreochromis]|uniref:AAA family ATPase n=1 Tax=Flavobacterium oreochromis TaxID=2906078 RepID=UPI00385B0CB9
MWTLTNNYNNWQALENEFVWVAEMKEVPQDPIHHAEGNVAIHTQMVLKAMQELPEFVALAKNEQAFLLAAALAHDIEKRSTTVIENGRVQSPGHAKKGAFTFRQILFEKGGLSLFEREQLAGLVRYHGFPIWLMEKQNPEKELLKVSLEANTKWLYLLAKADILGRICNDQKEMLERITLFKMMCEEYDCWGKPRHFNSTEGRFHYFNTNENYPDYQPFDTYKCTVHVLSALPGMGKDYFIKNQFDLPVISLDALRIQHKIAPTDAAGNGRIVQEAKKMAKIYLASGQDFVWNATNTSRLMREQLIALFVDYKAKVIIHYIEKPYKKWLVQNHTREAKVPENVLFKMLSKWQPPSLYEGHEVLYYED